MSKVQLRKPPVRLLGVVLALQGAFAYAQSTDTAQVKNSGELPAVVVTGSRFSEPLNQDTAVGTTVITADDIARSGVVNVYDALRQLGGVMTRINLAGTQDASVDLRGFGVTSDQNTLVLIDGMRVSENEQQPARLSSVPLNEIERIEILRSSGSVLYGGGATGGVINVITKKAAAGTKHLNVGVMGGSYGTTNYSLDGGIVGAPLSILGGAALGADLAYNKYSSDNYRVNNAVDQENMSGRFRVVGDNGEVGVRIASERSHSQLPGNRNRSEYQIDPRGTTTPNDWADTDANRYALYGNYRWQYVELAGEAYRREKLDRFYQFGSLTRSGSATEGYSPRARITAPVLGLPNQLVVGYDRSRWTYNNKQGSGSSDVVLSTSGGLTSDETGVQHNEAWYFKDDLTINKVRVTFGARRETLQQSTVNPVGFSPTTFTSRNTKLHAEELGVAWNFLPAWTVYGKAASSFRVANIDDNRFLFPTPGFLLPQTSRDLDAGLNFNSRAYDVEFHVYDSKLVNEIMLQPFTFTNVNLPPTERSGWELTGKWRPRSDLDLMAFYTQVRARFRSGSTGGVDVTGKEVPIVPRQRASLQANWRITGVDTVNVGWQYIGSQVFDNDQANTFGTRIPAYATIDARYTRRIGNVDLSLIGKNLGNKGYYDYGVASTTSSNYNVYPSARRAVYVSAVAHF